jgi:tRNA-2-methylthio-N6-dimethylallyladenosine synthase
VADDSTPSAPSVTPPMLTLPAAPKRVYMRAYGCQMNVYDGERMSEALSVAGYAPTDVMDEADLVVLNTCHIREKAVEKVYSDLGRVRDVKLARSRAGHATTIAVTGCVAQAEGREIIRRQPAVDVVVGPQTYHRLPDLVARALATRRPQVETEFADDEKFQQLPARTPPRSTQAFLTVQEGCDKFCTFCVVPYTRGGEFSRPVAALEAEARSLVERGVREITLLGQNVNAYHGVDMAGQPVTLAHLLRQLATIEQLARLRYTTSHPLDMGDDLIALHGHEHKLMPYLHLPIQTGSDRLLAAMNRRHTVAEYRAIIARVRAARPDIALSTDFIVGFPGETEADFEATLDIVHDMRFAQGYAFKYSARPGTPATNLPGHLAEDVKTARLARLQAAMAQSQLAFNLACVGRTLEVLLEKPGRKPGQIIARSPYLQSVVVAADASRIGEILPARVTAAFANNLFAEVVD